jgi:lysozyme
MRTGHARGERREAVASLAPNRRLYPLRGIDVSHYQGSIDWPAVAGDDISFAYIKASEGLNDHDPYFARNWRGAHEAGVPTGAYHYFIFCRSGRAQALNFLAAAPHGAGALPPAVDLEMGTGCKGRPTGARVRAELQDFLDVVEARQGRPAILYVTPHFYDVYREYLPRRVMWRRSVHEEPDRSSWAFWQYHSLGHVQGVRGHVDLNVFAADQDEFDRFLSSGRR